MFVIGILLFILLIVVHEFGHFIAAKRSGVAVEEFGIGFPPRLIGKKVGETIYSINWLPLGGFVRLKGENDSDTRPRSFGAARFRTKAKIILAGVAMNFLAAMVLLTVLAWFGIPKLVPNQYQFDSDARSVRSGVRAVLVEENSPAKSAGIELGDVILTINDARVESAEQMINLTQSHAGKAVDIAYRRDDQTLTANTTLRPDNKQGGYLGIGPADEEVVRYTYGAPLVGAATTVQFSWLTLQGLGGLVGNVFGGEFSQAAESVSGPVGIIAVLNNIDIFGWSYLVMLIAIISLTLAVMNVLPIPALDGGRLAVAGLFRTLRKPLTPEVEERIHGTGFAVLLFLIALITIVDIKKFF